MSDQNNSTPSQPNKEDLQRLQDNNLSFLLEYTGSFIYRDIPILEGLAYELIQIFNNVGLKSLLATPGEELRANE